MKTHTYGYLLVALLFISCSGGEAAVEGGGGIEVDVIDSVGNGIVEIKGTDGARPDDDVLTFDSGDGFGTGDGADPNACGESPYEFGCGCSDNGDCQSGFCVPSSQGFVCTEECLEECSEGWECKGSTGFGVDLIFICLPQSNSTCLPCESDEQCGEDFECVNFGDGTFCTRKCDNSSDCAGDLVCQSLGVEAGMWAYCQPASGSCLCLSNNSGQQRPCLEANKLGECNGYETCDPEAGWVGCSAPEPEMETCDGKDNDCDGSFDEGLPDGETCSITVNGVGSCAGIAFCQGPLGWGCSAPNPEVEVCDFKDNDCDGLADEDFRAGDKYVHPNHCGTCFNDCTGTVPNGAAKCDGSGEVPVCVVDECDEGFYPLGPFQCLPEGEVLCTPCASDLACEGGKCATIGESQFCTESWVDSECPEYFQCAGLPGLPGKWCVPVSNNCDCSKANAGASRPCSIANEVGTCFGKETCDPETGWSDCTAVPAEPEVCDGIDNDCSGLPDDGLPESLPCANTQEGVGTCSGLELCLGVQGWVCTAPKPEPEACDYKDNDCDGEVDEVFIAGGKYSTLSHCGECAKSCDGALPNAQAFCDAGEATPKCKVEECDEGFYQLNAFQCIEPPEVQCLSCENDADCYFGKCFPLAEGSYCLAQCDEGMCSEGYACKEVGDDGPLCVPISNTCECSADNQGATKGCSQTNGFGTCFGFETCLGNDGWSVCGAALPGLEACDGLDNDCNGLIDDGLAASIPCSKDNEFGSCDGVSFCQGQAGWVCQAEVPGPEECDFTDNDCDGQADEIFKLGGKYVTIAHCGTCNNLCTNAIPNGTGTCDPDYLIPKCVVDECAEGYFQLSPFECIMPPNTTCQPCGSDEDCVGSSCLEFDGKLRCASDCEEDTDCGAGYECVPYGDAGNVCQPLSGSCECTEGEFGKKRSCSAANELGECFGFETCLGEDGWSSCDALVPANEVCDGIDNDCNGLVDEELPATQLCAKENQWGECAGLAICQGALGWVCQAQTPGPEACDYADNDCDELVDEDFLVDGKYGVLDHCGSCHKNCVGALPNSAETHCDAGAANPVCKISECSAGFFPLNEFQCIEPPDVQCSECSSDDDCYFEKCVPLDQGDFCLSDCSEVGCGDGYQCESLDDFGAVCVPTSGSCECSEASAGAKRGCSAENEFGLCFGFETCSAESGWSVCDALVPADESCDGVDNDCNGLIDDGLPPSQPCSNDNEFGSCEGTALCQGIQGWVCQAATPGPEACDYQDNDCDGQVDEDFVDDGKYVVDDHCGTCNNLCFDAIPAATGICDASYPVPKCVVSDCDEGFFQLSPFQCVVPPNTTCQSCSTDDDCLGSACVLMDGKNRCAKPCEMDVECGGENSCLPYQGLGNLCQPASGSCECSSFNQGSKRSCSNINELGVCFGFQTCDADGGWSQCDALVPSTEVCDGIDNECNGLIDDGLAPSMPCSQDNEFGSCPGQAICLGNSGWVCQALVPSEEICDYQDNDCDGAVDELFVTAGKYDSLNHCGSCNKDCDGALQNATATCDSSGEQPLCKVDSCNEGFFKLNSFQCIEPPDVQCSQCADDGDCYFDSCVPLDQGDYCLAACQDGACSAGYHCDTVPGSGLQCVPDTLSCECGEESQGETRSCSTSNDFGTCFGLETCDPDNGWSDCSALVPGVEICDGIDNDCNGLVDDNLPIAEACDVTNEFGTCSGVSVCIGNDGWLCQAPEPTEESCDYQDNDCDGLIDETFKANEKYFMTAHCGTCNNACVDAIPNATGTCDVDFLVPKCVVSQCDAGFFQISPFQCVVPPNTTCQACAGDDDCLGSHCVEIDGKSRCARACDGDDDCAGETTCQTDPDVGDVCLPSSGSCECNSFTDSSKRSCSKANDIGTCYGFQTCDAETGWGDCDALFPSLEICDGVDNDCNGLIDDGLPGTQPCQFENALGICIGQATCVGSAGWVCQAAVPAVETCDYVDNDCDGEIDETFRNEDGAYDDFTHCGSCTISCEAGFPHATAACDDSKETPQCVVEGCDDGYFKLNEFQCIPNTASLCEACSSDDNCVLDGAKCVTLSDGNYCSKHCDDDADCPAGYSCDDYGGDTQCLPLTNSCACDGSNTELARSCSATWPVDPGPGAPFTTCYGSQACGPAGWSDCVLPDEVCDGLDNDCNGIIDDGFHTNGKYAGDNNCGQCGNNCAFLQHPNSTGVCDGTKTVPDCTMECSDGYFDVNSNNADGCECLYVGATDLPDGIDQNCDGVDGEVDNGIFVAKNGTDQNSGSIDEPMLTVQAAINMANQAGKRDVYVATGVYNGSLLLKQGHQVYGGYASTFLTRDILLYETVIIGGSFSEQLPAAVNAIAIGGGAGTTVFDGFTIFGRNNNSPGGSSYSVYVRDSGEGLSITNNHVVAGNGGNGKPGGAGGDGDDGTLGSPGDAAFTHTNNNCSAEKITDGGGGGTNFCGGLDVSGGEGGDSHCPQFTSPDSGEYGVDGDGSSSGGGGAGGGADVVYSYLNCNDQIGGTGGGGGSAGCSGTGATAGGGAGGSFGIFVFFSSTPATLPTLTLTFDEAGIGGSGGAGGAGGTGGVGGSGAQGGAPGVGSAWCAHGGGTGGDGGNGGHGGGGGGGCGGVSYCLYAAGQGNVSLIDYQAPSNTCSQGSGGPGGSGGPSIGAAGVNGQSGSGGATNF